jgi:hypothetical protein
MEARNERFLTVPVVIGTCLAAVVGTATVFYQTKVANPTVEEYFSFINISRLLIITHVHLFGYSTMGFVLWTLGRRHGAAANRLFGPLLGLTLCGHCRHPVLVGRDLHFPGLPLPDLRGGRRVRERNPAFRTSRSLGLLARRSGSGVNPGPSHRTFVTPDHHI